jgi:hypothetical protein
VTTLNDEGCLVYCKIPRLRNDGSLKNPACTVCGTLLGALDGHLRAYRYRKICLVL